MILDKILHVDFETCSVISLKERGLDNYARHPSTKVLLMAYAFGEEPVELWQPHLSPMPDRVKKALLGGIIVSAWNESFERSIFQHVLKITVPYERWIDPSIYAKYVSLPGSLASVCDILKVPVEFAKKQTGDKLIQRFSVPVSLGGEQTLFGITEPYFRGPESDPEEWEEFCKYCINDVVAERYISNFLAELFPFPEIEHRAKILDQKINDRGLLINLEFAKNGLELVTKEKEILHKKLIDLTGLDNPNSNDQLFEWIQKEGYNGQVNENTGKGSLGKKLVAEALAGKSLSPLGREVLEIRKESKKTSYTKLETLLDVVSQDGFLRRQFNFLGAARTGRWSGQDVQLQNLPSPVTQDLAKRLDLAVDLVRTKDAKAIRENFQSIINTVVTVIRSCIQAPEGYVMDVCDLNAIENRVLGWLSGCSAILEVFEKGQDPYLAFAALMYNVNYDELKKAYDAGDKEAKAKRTVAKPAVLGCGYGLGAGVRRVVATINGKTPRQGQRPKAGDKVTYEYRVIKKTDQWGNPIRVGLLGYAEGMGIQLTPEQAFFAHASFRNAYPEVVRYWSALNNAVLEVLLSSDKNILIDVGVLKFDKVEMPDKTSVLRMHLPSGRCLHYLNARVEAKQREDYKTGELMYDRDNQPLIDNQIYYDGIGHGVGASRAGYWGKTYTYGGKLTENADQAISRDILLNAMFLCEERGIEIRGHCHDELIAMREDVPWSIGLPELKKCMQETPSWASGLVLKADGWSGKYYKKG